MTDHQAPVSSAPPEASAALGLSRRQEIPDSVGLPPLGTSRWVIRRKAAVVSGVHSGLISLEEACRRYNLSVEEFLSWQRQIERHGLLGLRTTRLQDYRREPNSSASDPGSSGPGAHRDPH